MYLIRKLELSARLSSGDERALERLLSSQLHAVEARQDIIHEGDRPEVVRLIVDGWGYRYKLLEDRWRQIVAFFLPGDLCDLCDLNVYILSRMDHSVEARRRLTIPDLDALMDVSLFNTNYLHLVGEGRHLDANV